MIEVSGVSVNAGTKKIIESVSFSASAGENIAIIGPNGAGKTTLLKSLAGLTGFFGDIRISGVSIRNMDNIEKGKTVSYIPQGGDIDGGFTVSSFLELARYPYRRPWETLSEKDVKAVNDAVSLTDCGNFMDRELGTLSGGERQRVLIAGAIAQDCRMVLLDEPGSFLDPVQRELISRLISSISVEKNRLVLTVTHEINDALNYASRILVMSAGKLVFDGTPQKLVAENVLEDVFNAGFVKMNNPVTGKTVYFPGVLK